jgi:hypothetical protein
MHPSRTPTRWPLLTNVSYPTKTTVGTKYYVASNGSDANDGLSTAAPWATIAKVNTIAFNPGDKVFFRGGDTFAGKIAIARSGTATNPITIGSYGVGRATIQNTAAEAISIYRQGGQTVQDLKFIGGTTSDAAWTGNIAGIYLYNDATPNKTNITIRNCESTGFNAGIWVGGGSTFGFTNVLVENCLAHNNRVEGITSWGSYNAVGPVYSHSNVSFVVCVAHTNKGNPAQTGTHSGSGIVFGATNLGIAESCVAFNNGELNAATAVGPVGIWAYNANNILFQHCVSHSNQTGTAADGGGFDFDNNCSNSLIQYCIAWDNDGPGMLIYGVTGNNNNTGNTVRNNIFWGNATNNTTYGEIYIANNIPTTHIYNNTFIARGATPAVNVGNANPTSVFFRNNIFHTQTGPLIDVNATGVTTSNVLFQGNSYFRNSGFSIDWFGTVYSSYATWRSGQSGQETLSAAQTGSAADPQLVNATTQPQVKSYSEIALAADLKPQQGSPVLTGGINLASQFSYVIPDREFFGAIPGTTLIGAAED